MTSSANGGFALLIGKWGVCLKKWGERDREGGREGERDTQRIKDTERLKQRPRVREGDEISVVLNETIYVNVSP